MGLCGPQTVRSSVLTASRSMDDTLRPVFNLAAWRASYISRSKQNSTFVFSFIQKVYIGSPSPSAEIGRRHRREPLQLPAQVLGDEVQIQCRGADRGVTKDEPQACHVAAIPQVGCCQRVPQQMR